MNILFKMVLKRSAEVLSSAPRREKAVKCLKKKMVYWVCFEQAWVIVLLGMSTMLISNEI